MDLHEWVMIVSVYELQGWYGKVCNKVVGLEFWQHEGYMVMSWHEVWRFGWKMKCNAMDNLGVKRHVVVMVHNSRVNFGQLVDQKSTVGPSCIIFCVGLEFVEWCNDL